MTMIDEEFVRLRTPDEIRHWTGIFGVSESLLASAIKNVGNSVTALRNVFGRTSEPKSPGSARRVVRRG